MDMLASFDGLKRVNHRSGWTVQVAAVQREEGPSVTSDMGLMVFSPFASPNPAQLTQFLRQAI